MTSLICFADQQEVWQPTQLQSIPGQTNQTCPRIPHRPAPKKQQPDPLVRTFPPGSQGEPSLLITISTFRCCVFSAVFSVACSTLQRLGAPPSSVNSCCRPIIASACDLIWPLAFLFAVPLVVEQPLSRCYDNCMPAACWLLLHGNSLAYKPLAWCNQHREICQRNDRHCAGI